MKSGANANLEVPTDHRLEVAPPPDERIAIMRKVSPT